MAAPIYGDRVKETTTTTGTGTLSLGGTVTGYQTFVNGIGNGNTTKILIDDGNGNWEICKSVVTSGTPATLSRGDLIDSSTGSRIAFAAGTKTVAVVPSSDYFTLATRQILTSGSGATYTTPALCRQIRVRMVGGGAGGYSTNGGTAGADGTDTVFNSIVAESGKGAQGTLSGTGTGSANFRIQGGAGRLGTSAIASTQDGVGGEGASTVFGQGGIGGAPGANAGAAASANSGAGGGGGGRNTSTTAFGGPGGGAGEYVELIIDNPASTYTYTVGAGGTGRTAAANSGAGGDGGSGIIVVDEYY